MKQEDEAAIPLQHEAAEAANIYIKSFIPYDDEPSIDEIKEAYCDGFTQATLVRMVASASKDAEIERLEAMVKELEKELKVCRADHGYFD